MSRKALIIGIDNYLEVEGLNSCVFDAKRVAKILSKNQNDSPNFDVKLIIEAEQITVSNLKEKISELFKDDDDVCLLYFAGHGFFDSDSDKSYLCTYEVDKNNPGLDMEVIEQIIAKTKVKNKIVFLDCCYSGMFGNQKNESGIAKSSILYDNTTYLTASRKDETSQETANKGGVFTNLLLEALEGSASDIQGSITPASIYSYIDKSLGAWEQRPIFKTSSSKFIEIRKTKPLIKIEILRNIIKYFDREDSAFQLDPGFEPTEKESIKEKENIFKELQLLNRIGLVKPDGEEHMYYAAINSKTCSLTQLGKNYWKWVKNNRI